VTRADFLIAYPEFDVIGAETPELVDAKLAEAELFVSDTWGGKRDQIVGLLAAHLLAVSPSGRNAKLSSSMGKSTYGVELKKRRVAFASALNRLG
jgi:hypothetical protein